MNLKEQLYNLTKYNVWANEQVLKSLSGNKNLLDKEITSSFTSLRKTILHIWDAEIIWYKRLKGKSLKSYPSEKFSGTFSEMEEKMLMQSGMLSLFVYNKTSKELAEKLKFKNLKGEQQEFGINHIIQHCVNHSSFHRGQVYSILRILGAEKLFPSDYITFVRNILK
jgi:uncharacterized damage-inducible protein DinB